MRRRGFTLVELLLALLIISILAAMLFPVFSRARESARKTTCLSNTANLANCLQMYSADWQGALPPKDNDWSPSFELAKNIDVYHCPMDPKRVTLIGNPDAPNARVTIPYSSYVYRSGLTNDGPGMEVVGFDRRIWHLGGRNVFFLDAHAKWFSRDGFWALVPARVLALDPAFQELPSDRRKAWLASLSIGGDRP